MAYASKYYDPEKAHEYYMRTRELKGYENRYGGSRGDGTSAASSGYTRESKTDKTSSTNNYKNIVKKHNNTINNQIQNLRDSLNSMSKEDKKANRRSIQDQIQSLREQIKGGSTSGFNQKGKEAAAYIKEQLQLEKEQIAEEANKAVDNELLDRVKVLRDEMLSRQNSDTNFSNKEFIAKVKSLLGETKKIKTKTTRERNSEYIQKYKDEIDNLRSDQSMYTYYDRREEQIQKEAAKKEKESSKKEIKKQSNTNSTKNKLKETYGTIYLGN